MTVGLECETESSGIREMERKVKLIKGINDLEERLTSISVNLPG